MRAFFVAIWLALVSCGGALANVGSDCKQDKDQDLSIHACTLIIEGRAEDDKASAYNWRGYAYNRKGDYDRAIADIDQAIQLDPKCANAYSNRGNAYNGKGDYDRAIADYDQAIPLDPKPAKLYGNRGYAYNRKGDYDRAIADLDQAIQLDPKYAGAYNNRGYAYNRKGDYDRAIADLDQAIQLDPKYASAYNNRGDNYSGKGDYDRAIADYDQSIQLDPKYAIAYNNRGDNYNRKGEYDRAIADFDQAIQLDPKLANSYNHRGWALFKKGDSGRAVADISEAARLNPKYASARERRGHILLASGDAKSALDDFNEAMRLKADSIGSLWGRGQVYEIQGLRSLALADYKRAVELKASNPDDAEAQNKARARSGALNTPSAATPVLPQPGAPAALAAKAQVEIGRRVALVIGNSTYESVSALPNPKNDAAAVAVELTRLGFEVIEKHDLGVAGMRRALAEFESKAAGADWALVYYAGHGMELAGQNWLIPVNAVLARSNDVPDETVPLDRVLDRVRAAKKLRIVILDACRNNPFLSRMIITAGKSRAIDRGLARVEPEHGEVVFYAARDGSVASDGRTGEHCPFAAALLKHMSEDGVELGRFFRRVTSTVLSSTNPQQEPFMYGRLPDEDFYFKPPK
jgi:tetratricopeptide (TPR) repeat protein